uniref:Uncharacterized protein n=1 Tax=Leersia perrieri TaxID=77586 RepID=A0A0D9X4V8_9ORYZ
MAVSTSTCLIAFLSPSDQQSPTTTELAPAPSVILEMQRRPAPPAGLREGHGGVVVHAVARDAPPLPDSSSKKN